jgi:hypothetical protein
MIFAREESRMRHSTLQLHVLLLAGLGLAPGMAHLLELPAKLSYSPELYAAVNSTLYGTFGTAGGVIQLGALLAATVLAVRSRGQRAFRLNLLGTLAMALSLLLWATIVAPVNMQWQRVIELQLEQLPDAFARLRNRWEAGHVLAFMAWLAGYVSLLTAALYRRDGE